MSSKASLPLQRQIPSSSVGMSFSCRSVENVLVPVWDWLFNICFADVNGVRGDQHLRDTQSHGRG